MVNYSLKIDNVTQVFGRRLIFKEINREFVSGNIYGIAGKNGSGKSTFVKIIAGLISPTKGKVIHSANNTPIDSDALHNYMGFVSPYLVLYDEFTALENVTLFAKIRGKQLSEDNIKELFDRFGLYNRRNDYLKGYSSGMKQRMKFIFAILHSPQLFIFDEPTSNLDNEGKDSVYKLVEELGKENLVLIASNEEQDLALCNNITNIEDFKDQSK